MDTTIFEQHESEIRGYCRAYPTVFASASNARQVSEDGTSYIDFFAGAGVLNFGHNNPRMKEAMIEFLQADGVAHSLDTYTTTKRDFIARSTTGIVAEGRDITTVVAPEADARVLLTASEEVRLARRGLQLGGTQNSEQLAAQVSARDAKDSKVTSFTEAAEGVALVDSSELNFEETIAAVIEAVEGQLKR